MPLIVLAVLIILTSPCFWLIIFKPIISAQFYIPTLRELLINFFSCLSFNFLFFEGDPNIKNNIPETGGFLLWTLPFFLIGGYLILAKVKTYKWLIIFFIVALLFSSFFKPAPNILASLPLFIISSVIISLGIKYFLSSVVKRKIRGIFIVLYFFIILYNLVFFYHQYKIHYPKRLEKAYG